MSKIEWTNLTWNPTTGCSKVSAGCRSCYAEVMHRRLRGMGQPKYQHDFTQVVCHPSELQFPISIKKPTMFFVNSMSDLFHKDVPFDFIDNVFAVMDCCPQHTFQILTKRVDRMRDYFKENRGWRVGQLKHAYNSNDTDLNSWPLRNVLVGTSCEDRKTFNERSVYIAYIKTLGWRTMLSLEPLIGPIDLLMDGLYQGSFDWVIVGGESGRMARPLHPEWVRSLRDQCKAANVPFFFKQWGEYRPFEVTAQPPFYRDCATGEEQDGHVMNMVDHDHHSEAGKFNGYRWYPPMDAIDLCLEADSPDASFLHMGKSKSGYLLDGVEHREFPEMKAEEEPEFDPDDLEALDNFQPCDHCDLPDACEDFGCAVKQGLLDPNEF